MCVYISRHGVGCGHTHVFFEDHIHVFLSVCIYVCVHISMWCWIGTYIHVCSSKMAYTCSDWVYMCVCAYLDMVLNVDMHTYMFFEDGIHMCSKSESEWQTHVVLTKCIYVCRYTLAYQGMGYICMYVCSLR
jgi:hypothetical protein